VVFLFVIVLVMVLAKEILAIVIAVWGSDHSVDVLTVGFASRDKVPHSYWALMITLDWQLLCCAHPGIKKPRLPRTIAFSPRIPPAWHILAI